MLKWAWTRILTADAANNQIRKMPKPYPKQGMKREILKCNGEWQSK